MIYQTFWLLIRQFWNDNLAIYCTVVHPSGKGALICLKYMYWKEIWRCWSTFSQSPNYGTLQDWGPILLPKFTFFKSQAKMFLSMPKYCKEVYYRDSRWFKKNILLAFPFFHLATFRASLQSLQLYNYVFLRKNWWDHYEILNCSKWDTYYSPNHF